MDPNKYEDKIKYGKNPEIPDNTKSSQTGCK